jgi:hypothetical protein
MKPLIFCLLLIIFHTSILKSQECDSLKLINQSSGITRYQGDTASFSISVTGTSPSYQWQENGVNIINNDIYSSADSSKLLITDVTGLDGRIYSCIITNECSILESKPVMLKVEEIITLSLPSETACSGDTLIFPLNVTNFNNVGSLGIKISFDNINLIYLGIRNQQAVLNGLLSNVIAGNVLGLAWTTTQEPVTLGDNKLLDIVFIVNGGISDLTFLPQCEIMNIKTFKPYKLNLINSSVNGSGYTAVAGSVLYDNKSLSPLVNVKVFLYNSGKMKVDSVLTGIDGNYRFSNLSCGNYFVKVQSSEPIGGISPVDAFLVNKSFMDLYALEEGLRSKAADVNNSKSVNPVDALLINKRYIQALNSFTAGDWLFAEDSAYFSDTELIINFRSICYGDVDGSYIP